MPDKIQNLLEDPVGNVPAATVACVDPTAGDLPRRRLDETRLQSYLERLNQAGAPAVLMGASTGQGHLRTVQELAQWFTAAAQANTPDMMLSALLRPEDESVENQQLVNLLKESGYSIVYIRPGTNLPRYAITEQVVENLRPLIGMIAEAGMAVGLYSISDVSGIPLTVEVAEKLLELPGGKNIVAAKITEADYLESTREYLLSPTLGNLKIVQGWDMHIAQAMSEGPLSNIDGRQRVGITSGPMSFSVYQYLHILEAAAEHDWQEVKRSQDAVSQLFRSMQDDPKRFADLQRAKFIMGLGQPITAEVTEAQVKRVLNALDGIERPDDRARLAKSLDIMQDSPYHVTLKQYY